MYMIAGPNGSGKSTIIDEARTTIPASVKHYINADNIEKELKATARLQLEDFSVSTDRTEFINFVASSSLTQVKHLVDPHAGISVAGEVIDFGSTPINSYIASFIADFLRQKLIQKEQSFTFETVMSHGSKIDLLRQTRDSEYRNYLFFVATESYWINIQRVENRVARKGHHVDEQRIKNRYTRTLSLLIDAIKLTHAAYIFDNSAQQARLILEIKEGSIIEEKVPPDEIPQWVEQYVLRFRKADGRL
jgi:predicted ABC-type ATPase